MRIRGHYSREPYPIIDPLVRCEESINFLRFLSEALQVRLFVDLAGTWRRNEHATEGQEPVGCANYFWNIGNLKISRRPTIFTAAQPMGELTEIHGLCCLANQEQRFKLDPPALKLQSHSSVTEIK